MPYIDLTRGEETTPTHKPQTMTVTYQTNMLDKTFNPKDVEKRIAALWESSGAFACGTRPDRKSKAAPTPTSTPPPKGTRRWVKLCNRASQIPQAAPTSAIKGITNREAGTTVFRVYYEFGPNSGES